MYTRIMMSLYQPGKMDEALQIYRESILPTRRQQPGLKGVIVLLGHHSGMAMSITLWETEADLQVHLAKVVPFLTWAPVIETFEVGIWEIKLGTTVQFERVMTFHLQPETTGEFVQVIRTTALPVAKQQTGARGVIMPLGHGMLRFILPASQHHLRMI